MARLSWYEWLVNPFADNHRDRPDRRRQTALCNEFNGEFIEANKTSNLSKAHETRNSISSSCSHIVSVYLQSFCLKLALKCAPQPKIAKKLLTSINAPYFGVRLKSSKYIDTPKSSSPVLVMISSMSMPLCNCFHARQANIDKITIFRGVSLFNARVHRPPWT